MSKIKEKKEKLRRVWEQQKEITDKAHAEKRSLTPEEEKRWNDFDADFEKLDAEIKREEKEQKREAEFSKPVETIEGKESKISKREALQELIKKGGKDLSEEVREVLYSDLSAEARAQATSPDSAGGYLIPTELANEIIKSLKDYGGIRSIARVVPTASGNGINWPTLNDTANTGSWIGENTQASGSNLTLGQKSIAAFKATSGVFLIPTELLEDSVFDIQGFIREAAAERIGRLENAAFVNGDGSSKPEGFLRQATAAGNLAAKNAITTDEIINLVHSIDPAYRRLGCHFVFNDTTFKVIRKLKDDNDLYIWQMGDIRTGAPSTLLGHQYIVEQDMPSLDGTGDVKPIAFGNFQKFLIRDVSSLRMKNLVERYADYDQIGVIAFHRTDCELLDTAAVKYLRTPTT